MAQATPPVPPADDSIPPIPTPPAAPDEAVAPPAPPAPAVAPAIVVTPGIPAAGAVPPGIPPAGAAPVYAAAAPVAPAKRKIWPWVLGGGILLFVLLVVGLVVLVATILGSLNTSASPSATVLSFDKSFKDVDCTLFKSTTTPEFQASYFPDGFSCDKWEDIANSLHDGKTYNYTVDVHDSKVLGSTADVTTTEKDTTPGGEQNYELDYRLVKKSGGWQIDGITNLEG